MTAIRKMNLEQATAYANEMAEKLGLPQTTYNSVTAARMACIDLENKMTTFDNTLLPDAPAEVATDVPFDADFPDVPDPIEATQTKQSKYDTSGRRGPNLGTGAYARQRILEGADNKTILTEIKERFPEARTTMASVAFYRNQVKQKALESPEALRAEAERLREEAAKLEERAVALEAAATEAPQEAPQEETASAE